MILINRDLKTQNTAKLYFLGLKRKFQMLKKYPCHFIHLYLVHRRIVLKIRFLVILVVIIDNLLDNPPPGAYDVSESFTKVMESKSRAGLLSSQAKREIFKVNQNIPGPGEYSVKLESRIQSAAGAFLSTESRFTDKYEKLPGPGAYSKEDSSLVKKSYNVSFQEERRIV